MKKKFHLIIFLVILIAIVLEIPASQKKDQETPEKYKKWLEEDVVYIITPREKEIFLQLNSDKERDIFIEAFWKQRDPTPGTPENEFKEEHYRRISYANRMFGWGEPKPGWKTERGRIYIIMGEPNSIERYEEFKQVANTEVWFYQGEPSYGLPNAFNVVFFQKDRIGEYELYSPVTDGPQSLIIGYMGDQSGSIAARKSAYTQLYQLAPNLARASLSLVPSEAPTDFSPSFFSEVLLANIAQLPHKKVEDAWAEKLLRYKDIVEVEYTANYIDNDSLIRVIQDKSGIFFVHYAVEPKRLTLDSYQNNYFTNLQINANITDFEGNSIFQYEKTVPFNFNEEQLQDIRTSLFSFQDMFPLIEGSYRFHLLVKNTVSKEFTSVEKEIEIPKSSSLLMSHLTIGYKITETSSQGYIKPFQIGDFQICPSPRNEFLPEDKLYVFFQIFGLDEELKRNGFLEMNFYKGEERFFSRSQRLNDIDKTDFFLEEFSLTGFPPAIYEIRVSLFDRDKKEVLYERDHFSITPAGFMPRPWIRSITIPPTDNPIYSYLLGEQLLNKKETERALILFEKAYRKNPNSLQFAFGFSKALYALQEFKKVKDILLPFLNTEDKRYEFLALLGKASQALQEYEEALSYYTEYISHFGTNLNILNSIGECYFQMGNKEEALKVWEKSLEIDPKQENIKKIIESVKEKKDEK